MLGQLLQIDRREHGNGHAMPVHLGVGLLGQPQAVVTHQHTGAVDQQVHPGLMGAIEGEGHEVQLAILRAGFIAFTVGQNVRGQRPVRHCDTLGHAGRTRGVDHIGKVVL